jgi:AbrB family looped-hinge helix DNA binding protein
MTIATVSSKGQITLPAAARKAAGIGLHDRVVIEIANGAITVRPAPDLMRFKGFLAKSVPRDEEREAMARGAARHVTKRS